MVMPCRGCLHLQLYFIAALYTTFSRGRWPRLKAFFLVVVVAAPAGDSKEESHGREKVVEGAAELQPGWNMF